MNDSGQTSRDAVIKQLNCGLDNFFTMIPGEDWSMATIPELVANIVTMHHIPLRLELERLGVVVDRLNATHGNAATTEIHTIFHDFKNTLVQHLDQEEWDLFPLCIALEGALRGREVWKNLDVTSHIRFTSHGHTECESGLHRMMELLHDVITSFSDPDLALINDGFKAMAQDLVVHTAKEAELLLPAAIFSQERLISRRSIGHAQVISHQT